jgi:hypothetical protein
LRVDMTSVLGWCGTRGRSMRPSLVRACVAHTSLSLRHEDPSERL